MESRRCHSSVRQRYRQYPIKSRLLRNGHTPMTSTSWPSFSSGHAIEVLEALARAVNLLAVLHVKVKYRLTWGAGRSGWTPMSRSTGRTSDSPGTRWAWRRRTTPSPSTPRSPARSPEVKPSCCTDQVPSSGRRGRSRRRLPVRRSAPPDGKVAAEAVAGGYAP